MIFRAIRRGTVIFLDANTLIYDFSADPKYGAACKQLLERIARQELLVSDQQLRLRRRKKLPFELVPTVDGHIGLPEAFFSPHCWVCLLG